MWLDLKKPPARVASFFGDSAKAAAGFGLTVQASVLARADEVIE